MGTGFVPCIPAHHRSVSRLTFGVLVIVFISRSRFTTGVDTTLRNSIDQFLDAEATLQQVANPSGTVLTGGLGEPKFNINLSAFTNPWGR